MIKMSQGKVYLIGAGPGDEELLTLKAIRKLKECNLVMYDRLAGSQILNYINEDCKVYYCGKQPNCHYKTQDEINDMLVKFAKEGYTVGRIKGGDPYIFGRGGEEVLSLSKENIDFEVIPGITSFISVLNYAGIPVTHRNIAQGFHVFTGKAAKNLNINWKSAATIGGTLVFLMGFSSLNTIANKLIENGMDKNTPSAVVMRGTTSKQRKVISTLENIYEECKNAGLSSPCIFVIGEVVKFNNVFNWYEKKPLFGKNVCITRSKNQSKSMREKLIELGAQVTEIHSIKIKYTSENILKYIDKLPNYDYIVFTSVNGVESFFNRLLNENYDIRNIKAKFAVIGPATYDAVKKRGIIPCIVASKFVAESLYSEMKKFIHKGNKILVPRSKNSRPYLVEKLRESGCIVDECYTYETLCGDINEAVNFDDVDIVIFTSPTTVRNMVSIVGIDKIQKKSAIAIGPITGKELDKYNIKYKMSDTYTTDGIINKMLEK
jgi:uroporphyrinogen III methyltransferase / synthase